MDQLLKYTVKRTEDTPPDAIDGMLLTVDRNKVLELIQVIQRISLMSTLRNFQGIIKISRKSISQNLRMYSWLILMVPAVETFNGDIKVRNWSENWAINPKFQCAGCWCRVCGIDQVWALASLIFSQLLFVLGLSTNAGHLSSLWLNQQK